MFCNACRWHPEGLDAAPIRHSNLQPAPGTDLDTDDPEFSTSFDPKPDQQGFVAGRQAPSQRLGLRPGLASRLSVPELLDESGPFFDDSADQPTPKARKVCATLFLSPSLYEASSALLAEHNVAQAWNLLLVGMSSFLRSQELLCRLQEA